jgi:anti-sigma regulatory factor (Ser/Thr protein kinase)
VERTFPARAEALKDIRTFIRERAAQDDVPVALADDIVLAVSEASANAVVHVSAGTITIRWRKEGSTVLVWVCDEGVFRENDRIPELDGIGGRGIPLMQALMDDMTLQRGTRRRPGTVVCLAKRTDQHSRPEVP